MAFRFALAMALLGAALPAAAQTPLSSRPGAVPPAANPPGPGLLPPIAAPPEGTVRPAAPPEGTVRPARPPEGTARPARPPSRRRNGSAAPAVAPLPGDAPVAAVSAALGRDLEAAMALDAAGRGLLAGRDAVRARDALVRSPIAGSPSIGTELRSDLRGLSTARELGVEFAAPLWLPGQRGALGATIETGVTEAERRFALRRLEVAGLLRDAYWAVGAAEAERRLARERLSTARDIARDFDRRASFGDIAATEALLGRNEVLAAELELARTEAALSVAQAAYRTLTGGSAVALSTPQPGAAGTRPEPSPRRPGLEAHPALAAAAASLAAAEAKLRLVEATPRENPELGVFGRAQYGAVTEQGVSMGLRFRLPLATEARNAPRRAEAEAERTRAVAELDQARRVLEGEVAQARIRLAAAEQARRLAAERRGVAEQQMVAARSAFSNGEIGAFDLFRVRQLQQEALAAEAQAAIALGRARSVLNQAQGIVPGE